MNMPVTPTMPRIAPPSRQQKLFWSNGAKADRIAGGVERTLAMLWQQFPAISLKQVRSTSRRYDIVAARQACCVMLREQGLSLPEIGNVLDMHHTGVMVALRRAVKSF